MRILTVCRSGGEYRWEHVERLRAQCAEFAPGVAFRCLTDMGADMPLLHDWPGWWAKMEVFRQRGPCLYLDLDTTIVGDLAPLLDAARAHEFIVLRDVYRGRHDPHAVQSSVMAWSGDMRWLYDEFRGDPDRHMREAGPGGDQLFIQRAAQRRVYWQDVLPGHLVSWKADCASGVPSTARAVFFHGHPRPWQVGM